MRNYLTFILVFLLAVQIFGQETEVQTVRPEFDADMVTLEDTLSKLGLRILTDSLLISRQQANDEFCKLFEEGMKQEGAFHYPFDSLLSVSQLIASDNSFKVFTWQFFESDDSYVYYGYIMHEDGQLVALADKSQDYFNPQFEVGDKDHWYGALYYNMYPYVGADGNMQYLLFGKDGNSMFEARKVIDVLSWDENNLPVFGAEIFMASEESKGLPPVANRVIIEYFVAAKVSCNYEEIHEHVLFDHLIFKRTPYGEYMVPDGSYEGYVYEEGKWRHVSKMFHHSYGDDNYPTPEPVLTKEKKKDMFGNEHKRSSKNVSRNSKLYKEARAKNKKLDKEKENNNQN